MNTYYVRSSRAREKYKRLVAAVPEVKVAWFSGWLCADGCIPKDITAVIKFTICDKDPLVEFSNLWGNNMSPPQKPFGFGRQHAALYLHTRYA